MGLPLLESCLELYLTISGPLLESCLELLTISGFTFAGVMLGTIQPSVGLPLLESCLELLTISGFAFAGVMLGTLFNHQWVYLCWSHAWNS